MSVWNNTGPDVDIKHQHLGNSAPARDFNRNVRNSLLVFMFLETEADLFENIWTFHSRLHQVLYSR